MASELTVQTDIKTSVIRDGGYGFKLSNQFTVGIPDLLLVLYPFAPLIVEVKDLGEVVDKFSLKLHITPKQADTMRRISEPYEKGQTIYTPNKRASFVLVALKHRGKNRLVVVPRNAEHLTWGYETDPKIWTTRQVGKYYALGPLFEAVGAIQIRSL